MIKIVMETCQVNARPAQTAILVTSVKLAVLTNALNALLQPSIQASQNAHCVRKDIFFS
jgi:hypothetical protein